MGNRLFVGNLAWGVTEQDLRSFLGDTVTSVKIIADRETGRSRGFAFVEARDDEAASAIIAEFNGAILAGRDLRINEAEERSRAGAGAPTRGQVRGGGGGGGKAYPVHQESRQTADVSHRRDRGGRRRHDDDDGDRYY